MIKRENVRGLIAMRDEAGVLRVEVKGDPTGDDIAACFSEAVAAGIVRPPMPAVIELTDYSGNIAWETIRAIAGQRGWGAQAGDKPRVAYVTSDANFDTVIKLIAALFPDGEHRSFPAVDAA